MAKSIAPNGNMASATDPNFTHFKEEEAGILLPNIDGYPNWLPSLQLTASGRLCFWNMPKYAKKAIVSNPVNIGTTQFLSDTKKAYNSGKANPSAASSVGIDSDYTISGGGSISLYFWGNYIGGTGYPCNTIKKITQAELPDYGSVRYGVYGSNANYNGQLYGMRSPVQWLMANIQFYVNKYLSTPYDVTQSPKESDTFTTWLNACFFASLDSTVLTSTNFLTTLTVTKDWADKLSDAVQPIALSVLAVIGTPLLYAAAKAALSIQTKQDAANVAAQGSQYSGANTQAITKDVNALTSSNPLDNLTDDQKQYLFFAFILFLLLIIILWKTK